MEGVSRPVWRRLAPDDAAQPAAWPGIGAVVATMILSGAALPAQTPAPLRLTPELRIDAVEQDLSPIGWLAVGSDGHMAISQQQDGLVRFFDVNGRALGTFGRKGQGPGEFQSLFRYGWLADTLFVADPSTHRFTFVSPRREPIRSQSWLTTVSLRGDAAASARFTSTFPRAVYADGSQLLTANVAPGSTPPSWPGGTQPGSPILLVDRGGVVQRVIAWKPEVDCIVSARAGEQVLSVILPFCASPVEDVAPDGALYAYAAVERVTGRSGVYRVVVVRPNGDTLFARSYPYTPVAIPKSVVDSVVDRRSRGLPPAMMAAWRSVKLPDVYPPLARLLIGRDTTVWLEHYSVDGVRRWTVLDASGNPVGILEVARGMRLQVASLATLWATDADDDGLQSILRLRITR
jgi:hypothetical protein